MRFSLLIFLLSPFFSIAQYPHPKDTTYIMNGQVNRIIREEGKIYSLIDGNLNSKTTCREVDPPFWDIVSTIYYYQDNTTRREKYYDVYGNDSICFAYFENGSMEHTSIGQYDSLGEYRGNFIENFYPDGKIESQGYEFQGDKCCQWTYYDFYGQKTCTVEFDTSWLELDTWIVISKKQTINYYYLRIEYSYHENRNIQSIKKYKGVFKMLTFSEPSVFYEDGNAEITQGITSQDFNFLQDGNLIEESYYDESGALIKASILDER